MLWAGGLAASHICCSLSNLTTNVATVLQLGQPSCKQAIIDKTCCLKDLKVMPSDISATHPRIAELLQAIKLSFCLMIKVMKLLGLCTKWSCPQDLHGNLWEECYSVTLALVSLSIANIFGHKCLDKWVIFQVSNSSHNDSNYNFKRCLMDIIV